MECTQVKNFLNNSKLSEEKFDVQKPEMPDYFLSWLENQSVLAEDFETRQRFFL